MHPNQAHTYATSTFAISSSAYSSLLSQILFCIICSPCCCCILWVQRFPALSNLPP
ncbi:uncharacterized protein FOMMEDRAFT_137823 [Fomitiporia mediterranea MF3/22]|uniref:uncharacterized protein n=1 Tax=Fomitiporia mediterranea (strain MF3/22) TaxID=694068 RepID=UPI00044098CA|nr:uncharacterized protein FOMMEDRAFT_137823 [Fomitiporia mediterranea MF3/22]EJD07544.1 hypothetical protein FOMMEDRAFT_137823 [Fomitiporia mediterranea MF3/22]